jgi:hypothetical protein
MDHLLAQVGITGVVWNQQATVVVAANDGTAGYILSRQVERNRRPVAFAFAGAPPEPDGKSIHLDAERLRESVNAEMLRSGLAYPTYYKGLFADLREECTALVSTARNALRGLWHEDKTNIGFEVTGMESITSDSVILPKLFRRLTAYLEGGGPVQGFTGYLEQLAEEVLIISTANSTHFDNLVEVIGNAVRMTQPPENLMFAG